VVKFDFKTDAKDDTAKGISNDTTEGCYRKCSANTTRVGVMRGRYSIVYKKFFTSIVEILRSQEARSIFLALAVILFFLALYALLWLTEGY
jgi:hypothetical protein